MKPWLLACAFAAAAATAAPDLTPADFAWRGTLDVPPGAALARVSLPGEALARLQSPALADLRVFDGQDRAVAFARAPTPPTEPTRTPAAELRALPLFTAEPGARLPKGAVQLRLRDAGGAQVWVQVGGAGSAPDRAPRTLQAAIFDTRALKEEIAALKLAGEWPRNVPVRIEASTSTDLGEWTPLPLQGRIYRFEGDGAPANDTLELAQALSLQGRYLRLAWSGQEGVRVATLTALRSVTAPTVAKPAAELPPPRSVGPDALEWQLPFATPVAELELRPTQANTLLPVRILGRDAPSQPWRVLGQTVVYRLAGDAPDALGPPARLPATPVRWLRVEATHGMRLQDVPLAVRAVFEPVELVFVAGGATPYRVAAGRAETAPAALPLSMLAATQPGRKLAELPLARVTSTDAAPPPARAAWAQWLPAGVDAKTAGLWAVLLAGVAVLGAAAWSLLRTMNRVAPLNPPAPPASPGATPAP